MNRYVKSLNEWNEDAPKYNTSPDDDYDAIISKSGQEIRISQKDKDFYILSDGSYFVYKFKDDRIKSDFKYTHFFTFPDSSDTRISLDKFRLFLDDLKDLFGNTLKNTLIYSKDGMYNIVDNKGNILE